LCVCGGIAAFKTAALASQLAQAGAGVTVTMTRNGRRFVGPTTFRALTGRPVHTTMWGREAAEFSHLRLSEAADLIVVAPATANVIGKLAGGIADDLVSTLLLGADSPVLMAPAMNTRMWQHASVQRNMKQLRADGVLTVGPDDGWLACGDVGPGRMVSPQTLFDAISEQLLSKPPKGARKPSSEA